MYIGGNLPYFYGANSVWIACIDHTPSPMQGVLNVSIGWGPEREVNRRYQPRGENEVGYQHEGRA